MSPHVNTFVNDLVTMAKAMEQVPVLEAALAEATHRSHIDGEKIAALEIRCIEYNRQIDELRSKLRDTEVARDDAELRFLELDEKASKVISWLADIDSSSRHIRALVEPVLPEPQPEVKPAVGSEEWSKQYNAETEAMSVGQGALDPIGDSSVGVFAEGQSEPLPTSVASTTEPNADTSNASTITDVAGMEPNPGPYSGKLYIDVPGWISLYDWLAGGGTEPNYHYRRA